MLIPKKVIFCLIAGVLVCGLIEIFCLAALYLAGCDNSTQAAACQNPKADLNVILPPWMTNNVGQFIIHPYLGFVYNPDNLDITRFGFLDTKNPIQKKTDGKIIIGIFGGSSAEILGQFGAETLKNDLLKDPEFEHKEIIVLNLAIGGYKQPQQVMVLNYLLALGGEFDFVINLDGFNELVLPVLRNLPNQVNPFFPRRWDLKVVDSAILYPQIVILADILKLEQKKLRQANLVHCGILRFSSTARLLSYCLDRSLNLRITVKRTQLFDLQNKQIQDTRSVVGHGPEFNYDNQQDLYEQLTALWARSSKQMDDLCAANKIEYFHFIQPCQYVPDSKIMDAEELKAAFDPDARHRQTVINGYPVLRQQAEGLKQQGIAVYDLSMVFENYSQPLYIDTFCHFGQEGSQIIAQAIAKTIIAKHEK
ncbi:MAG: hypothetical protein KKD05_01105 [Candidatus Omnitrophica bacterium]|nr:hypothetical protein [Candidatus Omnitrophota bacterium]